MTRYGYARISDGDTDPSRQERSLTAWGAVRVFTDHGQAAASAERPALAGALAGLLGGDELGVTGLDRFGMTTKPLCGLLAGLAARGVAVHDLGGPVSGPASGRLLAAIAAADDAVTAERRRRKGARPKLALTPQQTAAIREARAAGADIAELARQHQVSRGTIYRALDESPGPVSGTSGGRPPTLSLRKQANIRAAHEDGVSVGELAARYKVSRNSVYRILGKMD